MAYSIELNFHDFSIFEKLDEPVLSIELVRVYYLVKGRNAWYSTWVETYNKTSFHSDFNSAKDNAEKLREKGSKFYIDEIPGILIKTKSWDALVLQINTNAPFGDYSHLRFNSNYINKTRKKIFLRRGMPISTVLNTFAPTSQHWSKIQSFKNNIIVEIGKNTNLEWNTNYRNEWKGWKSYSDGGGYMLRWGERESKLDINPIKNLILKVKKARPSPI